MPPKRPPEFNDAPIGVSPGPTRATYSCEAHRDGSGRVGLAFPHAGPGGSGGPAAPGDGARRTRRCLAAHDNADAGAGDEDAAWDGDGPAGGGEEPAGLRARSAAQSERRVRACAARLASRPAAQAAYTSSRPEYDAAVEASRVRVLRELQARLDSSFRDMPRVKPMYDLLAQLGGKDGGVEGIDRGALDALVQGRLRVTYDQEVRFLGMGIEGTLKVPTWVFDERAEEAYTPPPSTCFCVGSSPTGTACNNGTTFFHWELLEWFTPLFFSGVSAAGKA